MVKLDILQLGDTQKINTNDSIFDDLCFENIKKSIFPDDTELYKCLCEVLKHPSSDADTVRERQAVFEDFCSFPRLANDILKLCYGAQEFKITMKSSNLTPNQRLKEYLDFTIPLLETFERIPEIFRGKPFKSKTLKNFHVDSCSQLIDELKDIAETKSHDRDYIHIKVSIGNGFKLFKGNLIDLSRNNVELPYNKKSKEQITINENCFSFSGLSMAQFTADEIRDTTIFNLCSIISHINFTILSFFKELKKAVFFYMAALELKRYMDIKGLYYCKPEIVSDKSVGIEAEGIYDFGLSAYLGGKKATGNDFDFKDGKIIVITGLNQGGKTTFLRSVGIAQLFAQAGLFVPAKKYRCSAFSGIMTHFPKEEDDKLDNGKLAEELTRLSNDFPILLGGGLALFNESFATTTAKEGAELAEDVLRAVSETNSCVVFVTHLYELATHLDSLNMKLANGCKAFSMVTEFAGEKNRTYKIVKGAPLENIFAANLFD